MLFVRTNHICDEAEYFFVNRYFRVNDNPFKVSIVVKQSLIGWLDAIVDPHLVFRSVLQRELIFSRAVNLSTASSRS